MATVITAETIDAATGRARPRSEQEQKTRSEAFAEIAEMIDDTDNDEIWVDVFRGVDDGRPHRPLFEGGRESVE